MSAPGKQSRIFSKFSEFRERDQFIDIVIHVGDESFRAHKLVLAKFSSYFARGLSADYPTGCIDFSPDFNPQEMFIPSILFLYTHTLDVNSDNVLAYLSIGERYEINVLLTIAHDWFVSHIPDESPRNEAIPLLLKWLSQSVAYEVDRFGLELIESIGQYFPHINRQDLWESLNPRILHALMSQILISKYGPDECLSMIDEFHLLKPINNEEEREALAEVFVWSDHSSHQLLTRHNCSWLPVPLQRRLLLKVMENRRVTARQFRERAGQNAIEVSRWFPFTWVQSVQDADGQSQPFEVDAVAFARTLGGAARGFDPIQLGTVIVTASPHFRHFAPAAALNGKEDEYFMSSEGRSYEIDLGPLATFLIRSMRVVCRSRSFFAGKAERLTARNEKLAVGDETEETLCQVPGRLVVTVTYANGTKATAFDGKCPMEQFVVEVPNPVRKVAIKVAEGEPGVLRIFDVALRGEYVFA
jgi:hypothetical protein